MRVGATESHTFPPSAESVALARRAVGRFFASEGIETRQVLALIVSELATNAVLHAGTGFTVTVGRSAPDRLRVEVLDRATDFGPTRDVSAADASGGRGLFLVGRLATDWGVVIEHPGKRVWAELCTH